MRLTETSEALHKLHLFPVTTLETQLLHTRHWQEVRRILRKEDTEKYREFQARFSLFFILFLTEQFRNGALSVTHQRMITITLRGAY